MHYAQFKTAFDDKEAAFSALFFCFSALFKQSVGVFSGFEGTDKLPVLF